MPTSLYIAPIQYSTHMKYVNERKDAPLSKKSNTADMMEIGLFTTEAWDVTEYSPEL